MSVKDCISIKGSNVVILVVLRLSRRIKGSNVVIKIDITKAFDTINWYFLIQVLHYFDFH